MTFEENLLGGASAPLYPGGRLLIGGRRAKHLQIWMSRRRNWSYAEYLPFESSESLWASEDGDAVLRIDGAGIPARVGSGSSKRAAPMPPRHLRGLRFEGNELVRTRKG